MNTIKPILSEIWDSQSAYVEKVGKEPTRLILSRKKSRDFLQLTQDDSREYYEILFRDGPKGLIGKKLFGCIIEITDQSEPILFE